MGKFSGASSVRAAQEGRLADLELPTGPEVQEEAPSPPPSALQQELRAAPLSPEEELQTETDVQAATAEALPELQQEVERQRVPSLAERGTGEPRVDRWLRPPTPVKSQASNSSDGNLRSRAKTLSAAVAKGDLGVALTSLGTPAHSLAKQGVTGPELASEIATHKEGDLFAAISRADAVQFNPELNRNIPDPVYTQVASAVVENEIANIALGQTETEADVITQAQEGPQDITVGAQAPQQGSQPVTHATGNGKLGQQIHQEYQRMNGVNVPEKLPQKEAETLGAAFKHLWAASNPELVTRAVDPKTQQIVYQLTAAGEKNLKDGEADRKRLFPKQNVRPAKQPLQRGQLPGDVGQNVARRVSGSVGKQEFGKVIQGAMNNMAQVPNVVDKQRAKILFQSILPVLRDGSHDTWQAEINNIGPSKIQKFQAAKVQQDKRAEAAAAEGVTLDEDPYSPEENLASLVDKVAQEVRAVAQERNGANYLSYNVQGFQGRITPQQSFFNPTTSKAVRFVTRNATPSVANPGTRVEKNLRQMYAMMILPKSLKADVDLPVIREQKLTANSARLEAWGDRLAAAVNMTDAEYEAVAQAIEAGTPLTDPNFPQVRGLELDPEADAELIKHIESKGEDGPHVIDGLMDFAQYAKAKRAGRPHRSYFNAYMDGKTNGLASNGIQMGHLETAERTGVLRSNRNTLLDEGDIRDELQRLAVESIADGWDGETDGFESELNDVAEAVFAHRDLNKMTTMTFGYGKEIDSFSGKIEETLAFLNESRAEGDSYHNSLAKLDETMNRGELAKTLMNKYESSLREVMSEEALQARSLMRSAAALHSATNQLFSIKSPVGMDLNLGRDVTTGYDDADKSAYRLYGEGGESRTTVAHYKTEPTAAAARTIDEKAIPGEYAYGGSVVAPVQAMDAATVALTANGKSWDRLRQASGGNPYMHTIYDAFKVDANGYDVVLEEVNKNWLNSAMNWSYLEATYDATKEAMTNFQKEMSNRPQGEALSPNEKVYMEWFLEPGESKSGKTYFPNLVKKMQKFKDYPPNEIWNVQKKFVNEMKAVGYDMYNPPEAPTVVQLRQFVKTMSSELDLRKRMDQTINRTNNNKKKLKQEILKRGYKTPSGERIALQYYAH